MVWGSSTKLCTVKKRMPSTAEKPARWEKGGTRLSRVSSGAIRHERYPVTLSSALSVGYSIKPRDRRRRVESLRRTRRSHWDGPLNMQVVQPGRHQRRGDRIDSRYRRGEHRRRTRHLHGVASRGRRGWHNLTMFMCVVSVGMSMVVMTAELVLLRRWG